MTAVIFVLLVGLAAANGSNDVAKGVATLAGAGVARYRTAILWGTCATLAGALCSLAVAKGLTTLFSKGIVTAPATDRFALAVLVGTAGWVALATMTRLPVSTTHALVGSLIGGGLLLSGATIHFGVLVTKVAVPLLASAVIAYVISALLGYAANRLPLARAECVCVGMESRTAAVASADGPGAMAAFGTAGLPVPRVYSGTRSECAVHGGSGIRGQDVVNSAHWLSSGAVSFARGLNDTPKIVAVGTFALVPAGMSITQILLVVAFAMAAGAVAGGIRVAHRLGEGVVKMSHLEGLTANLTTALLVGLGAFEGMPMSTTHVSTGAIAGTARSDVGRLNGRSLRDFALAWTVTPAVAGGLAVTAYLLLR
jgi:PiT family inorganic phosphate transporter